MTANEMFFRDIAEALASTSKQMEASKMFGKPCVNVNGKAFICFFQDAMVFKLTGAAHAEALALPGAQLFDPSGKKRPMKDWVQVPGDHKKHWARFAGIANGFVSGVIKPAPAKKEAKPAAKAKAPAKAAPKAKPAKAVAKPAPAKKKVAPKAKPAKAVKKAAPAKKAAKAPVKKVAKAPAKKAAPAKAKAKPAKKKAGKKK